MVAGLLLTGGQSRRMGRDKAAIAIGRTTMAERLANLLGEVTRPVLEVGPGRTALLSVPEATVHQGPLAAIAAGARALAEMGHSGPALVLACDLPLVPLGLLQLLAHWPGAASVLPVVGGLDQPLCARWSAADLALAPEALRRGDRSLRGLPVRAHAVLLGAEHWGRFGEEAFLDVDTPEDLAALGRCAGDPGGAVG